MKKKSIKLAAETFVEHIVEIRSSRNAPRRI